MISKEHFKIPFSITVTCYIGKQLIGNHSAEGFFFYFYIISIKCSSEVNTQKC